MLMMLQDAATNIYSSISFIIYFTHADTVAHYLLLQ